MITRFVALGDSFTEGLEDSPRFDGRHRGWADRLAERLPQLQGTSSIEYANLAVRGRLLSGVVAEQVPVAVSMEPDFVTFAAGVNDALRREFDLDALATEMESGVRALRDSGAQVLIVAFGDPGRRSGVFGKIQERMRVLRSATLAIADAYDCLLVDFWGVAVFDDDRMWSHDRLHLSPLGHLKASEAALQALGLADDTWRAPVADPPRNSWRERRTDDIRWVGAHAGPWVMRRVRGTSSGAGIEPKDPQWRTIHR